MDLVTYQKFEEFLSQEHQLVVLSDVHVKTSDDAPATLLTHLLEQILRLGHVQNLVLNGDIFDFYFGARDWHRKRFARIFSLLTEIATRHPCKIFFVEGNHEFALGYTRAPGIQWITQKTLTLPLKDGAKVAITHGDLLPDVASYKVYHTVFHSPPIYAGASLLPPPLFNQVALAISEKSRQRYRVLNHAVILEKASSWLNSTDASIGVFGHFHYPYLHQFGSKTLACVESWDRPNVLSVSKDKITRYDVSLPT